MKKRNYTYQIDGKVSQFNLNASNSLQSQRNHYTNLRPSAYTATTDKQNKESEESATIWINEEPDAIAIADELCLSELKTFSFRCIEAMANLANFDKGQTISQVLENLVRETLPAFITLIDKYQAAKNEYHEYRIDTLASRIESLTKSIPSSVENTGIELQLPSAVMTKLANHLKLALTSLAK